MAAGARGGGATAPATPPPPGPPPTDQTPGRPRTRTVAMAMTAATSTRDSFERPDTGACIDPDVSITTRVPSSGGMLATVTSRVRPRARFQLSDGACLYAAHTWN